MPRTSSIGPLLLATLQLLACAEPPPGPGLGAGAAVFPLPAADSPLLVHYPNLDRRIVAIDPASGVPRWTVYPDRWYPDLHHIRDFAVDRRHLYLLLGSRQRPDDPRLFIVDPVGQALLATLPLPPQPDRLVWNRDQLLVGHGTGASGPPGRLTRVDTVARRVGPSGALQGACLSIAAAGPVAFALERTARIAGGRGIVSLYTIAEVELASARVRRRLPLPGGARQLVHGPGGLLYVAHASGGGQLETDGTISVVDPVRWQIVARLRLDTIPRQMIADLDHLVINTLTTSGEPWLTVLDRRHRTVMDLRFETLPGEDLALIAGRVYTPHRRGNRLARIDLLRRSRLAPLPLHPRRPYEDQPGPLRTRMELVDAH